MKKMILPLMGVLLLCLDLVAQNVQYKVNHAGIATTCPPEDVASDFGPRKIPKYDWHGGVDYSPLTGNQDRGYTLLAIENGTISYIHNLAGIGFKYLRIDGTHHYGYGHIFTSNAGIQELGDFKLVKLLAPHSSQFAIYNTKTQTLFHTCKINANDIANCTNYKYLNGTDTITATNQVTTGSEIGPMGTSIDGRLPNGNKNPDAAVEAHLHLYNFGTANNNTASDVRDGNTLNPLQFANHTEPAYIVNAYKNSGFTQQGIGLVYPGTERTKVGVRVRMSNQSGGGNYSAVMNINRVKLSIRKGNQTFKVIEGLNYESRIDYGGRTDAPDHYPAKNASNILTLAGTWGADANSGVNGIVPKAYSSTPEDDYYFTDFVTRIHKNHVPGNSAIYADFPSAAKYNDGNYDIEARMTTVTNQEQWDTYQVTIYNFKPFINHVEIAKRAPGNGPTPIGGNELLYKATSWGTDDDLTTSGDGKVKFRKLVNNRCWTKGVNLQILVYTSEPMQSLSCKIPQISSVPYTLTSTDGVKWVKIISGLSLAPNTYTMEFTGSDMSGNALINVRTYPTDSQDDKEIRIPSRIATSGTLWLPNPTSTQVGKDTYHSFTIKNECNNSQIQEDIEIRAESECPFCSFDESFSITQTKVLGSNGKTRVSVNANVTIPNGYIAIWKDKDNNTIGTGITQILYPGDYCVEITYNECCEVRLCFEIEGCDNIVQDVVISPSQNSECLSPGPWEVEVILKEGETLEDKVEWYYNNQPLSDNGLFLQISESGNYTYRLNTTSGCSAEGTFSVEDPKLYNSIKGQVSHICGQNKGSIRLNCDQELEDAQSGWYYDWYFDGDIIENNHSLSLLNIEQEGYYTIVFSNEFTGCQFEKSFLVQDLRFYYSDFHNPTCAGYPNDGTVTVNVNSQYPYTIAWEQGNQCCTPPYLTGNMLNNAAPYEYSFGIFDSNGILSCGGNIRFDCCYKDGGGRDPEPNMTVPSFTSTQLVYTSDNQSCDGAINFTHNMLPTQTNLVTIVKMPEGIVLENSQNLCVGQYCITLNNGCSTKTECFEVKSCEEFVPQVTANITHTCPGYAAGSISLNLDQVDTPYTIQWQTEDTTSLLTNLGVGTYCVSVTDVHLCTFTQCYTITSVVNVTRDNNCHIFCNGIDVDNKNPTYLGDFLESDCRYRRKYCSDGYEIGTEYVGVQQVIIDAENCILQDYCYNGEPYGPLHVGLRDTVYKWDECSFEIYCSDTKVKTLNGIMTYGKYVNGKDDENNCVYAFKADECEFNNQVYYTNVEDGLTIDSICPIPEEHWDDCMTADGKEIEINSSNASNFCWKKNSSIS